MQIYFYHGNFILQKFCTYNENKHITAEILKNNMKIEIYNKIEKTNNVYINI